MGTKEKKDKIKEGIEKYLKIKDLYPKTNFNVNSDFAKAFGAFYLVRRNEAWRKMFFDLFKEMREEPDKADFETILKELNSRLTKLKGSVRSTVEASFASKMLHTIDNDSPIWDRKVIDFLVKKGDIERPKPYGVNPTDLMKDRIEKFQKLKEWYKNKSNIQPLVDFFNQNYKTDRSDEISDVKKADFIIWGLDLDKVLEIISTTPASV